GVEDGRAYRIRGRQADELLVGAEPAALEEAVRDDDRPDDRVIDEYEEIQAGPRRDPQRGHRPHERGRREAEHPVVRADQGPGAKEADARDDAAEERQRIVAFQVDCEDGQRRRAGGYEDERPEPNGLAANLPLQANP